MIQLAAALAAGGLALAAIMTIAWLIQQKTGNSGWIDTIWTFGTGFVAAGLALWPIGGDSELWRQLLVAVMAASWSARLGWHIAARTRHATDDPRYLAMMKSWGAAAPRRLFWFLQAQAAVGLVLAGAVMVAAHRPLPGWIWTDVAAIAVFVAGWLIETLSDAQLASFKRTAPSGSVCDIGLWSWSRHPNYFGEWLCWCAYPLLALGSDYPLGLVTLVAPAIIYWTLVYASGIPPLEAHMQRSRPQAWAVYARRTSPFFPRPPRS